MKIFSKRKLLFFILFILFIFFNLFIDDLRNFVYEESSNTQIFFFEKTQGFFLFSKILNFSEIVKENFQLKEENQELLVKITELSQLKEENQELKNVIGLENNEFELQLVRIRAKDSFQGYYLINAGENNGIEEGQPVITSGEVLIGKIDRVYDDFSRVLLISNQESSIDIEILERDIVALAKGTGEYLSLDLISKDKELKEGDLVVTSALGGNFPEGLLVGRICEVEREDVEAFVKAKVSPLFTLQDLDYVFIIKNSKIL